VMRHGHQSGAVLDGYADSVTGAIARHETSSGQLWTNGIIVCLIIEQA
jgi:hypothetical protein